MILGITTGSMAADLLEPLAESHQDVLLVFQMFLFNTKLSVFLELTLLNLLVFWVIHTCGKTCV